MRTCPACGSPYAILLGDLGRRRHLRCRDCGMDYSHLRRARNAYTNAERFIRDLAAQQAEVAAQGGTPLNSPANTLLAWRNAAGEAGDAKLAKKLDAIERRITPARAEELYRKACEEWATKETTT